MHSEFEPETIVMDHAEDMDMAFIQWVDKLKDKRYNNWEAVIADADLANFPGRVELNKDGDLILMPPPELEHAELQSNVARILGNIVEKLKLKGKVLTEFDVKMPDGNVRRPDVAYLSLERRKKVLEERESNKFVQGKKIYTVVPEICIEIKSVSNTWAGLHEKKNLFFTHGALEVWIVDEPGNFKFYENNVPDNDIKKSRLIPEFPAVVEF